MQEISLPQWARDHLTEMIDGYLRLLSAIKERCEQLAASGRHDADGELCDDIDSLAKYRLDAKYCAGQVVRLCAYHRTRVARVEWAKSPYAKQAKNPRKLAEWAWKDPWQHLRVIVVHMESAPLTWREFYLRFTERERRALVYTIGGRLKDREAAQKMNVSQKTLEQILLNARKKFGPNTTMYLKVEENHS